MRWRTTATPTTNGEDDAADYAPTSSADEDPHPTTSTQQDWQLQEEESQQQQHHHSSDEHSQSQSSQQHSSSSSSSQQQQQQQQQIDDDDENDDQGDATGRPAWRPQKVPSTTEFTHTIRDYASKREGGCKKAEYSQTVTDEHGNRWRLIVYVNGNGRASNHHLSLFLQVADAEELEFGWKKAVSYVLTLEHPDGTADNRLSYAKRNPDKIFKLCPKAIDWGWSQFITSDRIQQDGFIRNDSLTVRACVTVKNSAVSIDEEDAELYLKCAVEEGDTEAVKLCLENGASVNCQFKDDLYTPLHTACSSQSSSASSAAQTKRTKNSNSKSNTAADSSGDVLHLLLAEGADGNACNKWRETPLLIAANNGHAVAVSALLANGADPALCSEAGWSALTFAAHKGYDDIVSRLLQAGAPVHCPVTEDSSTPLHKACAGSKPGHLRAVQLLLAYEADVHALNKWRETPLLTAANHGQALAVDALLQHGADPCKCTDTGWSPLSIAAYKGHDEVVRLLLEDGAPTEEDDPTLSALLQAATKGLPDTVELLLRHGADHTVTTKKGDTALSILVEQNLIETAVEMVTEHNANIARCSRDRKKVQRARLLINLHMKQQEREGKNNKEDTDDEETDDEEAPHNRALHVDSSSESASPPVPSNKRGKKKKGKSSANRESAEEKARAAEEALLLELEQEETAKKEKAEASNKRRKKKERKAKEREQKLREEQAKKRLEEEAEREKLRLEKEKAALQRQERDRKILEQREKEKKELMERERLKQKEREEKERKETDKRVKVDKDTGNSRSPKRSPKHTPNGAARSPHASSDYSIGNRRWETTKKSSPSYQNSVNSRSVVPQVPLSLHDKQAPRSAWSLHSGNTSHPVSASMPQSTSEQLSSLPRNGLSVPMHKPIVEHPAIALRRREHLSQLLNRCQQALPLLGHNVVSKVMYRWTVRAAHDSSPRLDPIIPSWTDGDKMTAFFQRQLIAENRKSGSLSSSMEALKEAGALIAVCCQNSMNEMLDFRRQVESQLPGDWDDAAVGVAIGQELHDVSTPSVVVHWNNRSQVNIVSSCFASLKERYVGPSGKFLTACFVARMMYDTRKILIGGTPMDYRLPPAARNRLKGIAAVTSELWTDPFSVDPATAFWGVLENVDTLFGGHQPFSKYPKGTNRSDGTIAEHGGSVSTVLPLDATVASAYVQQMLHLLQQADTASVGLSFFVFANAESFHDVSIGVTSSSLIQFDPRLGGELQGFVQAVEILSGNRHSFLRGEETGDMVLCTSPTLFFVLQNETAQSRFGLPRNSLATVSEALRVPVQTEQPIIPPLGLDFRSSDLPLVSQAPVFDTVSLPTLSPDPNRVIRSEFGAIGGTALQPFSPVSDTVSRGTRRPRLFDLVDNGEEAEDVDVVSQVFNGLDLFRDTNVGTDVDIEAISLYGIGAPNSRSVHPESSQQRF